MPGELVLMIRHCLLLVVTGSLAAAPPSSHPPLRRTPPPSNRPLPEGPVRYVDAAKGDDQGSGRKDSPWRSIYHALTQLRPGDTLCLRGGVYRETVLLSLAGRKDAPITLRSFP